jgi:flagellar biosynthesis/type III secretory pathway protein FliH
MKLSSKTSFSEPKQAQAWMPVDIGPQVQAGSPDLAAEVLSIFATISGQTPAEAPRAAGKTLIRAADQPQALFQAWRPGDMEMLQPTVVDPAAPVVAFPTVPVRRSAAFDPSVGILGEARRKADEILRQAQRSADEDAQRTAAQSAQAVAEGYARGQEDARAEAASSLRSAQAMISELADWREQMISQSEETILSMIRQIASLMFGSGIRLDKDALQTYLNEVVENTRSLGDLNIFLSPDDFTRLEPAWAEHQAQIRGSRVRVAGSAAVLPGGCLIKGQMGSVDASVETKLAAVLETLSPESDAGAQE